MGSLLDVMWYALVVSCTLFMLLAFVAGIAGLILYGLGDDFSGWG